MANMAEIEPEPVVPTPSVNDDESVSDSESVTTEDVYDLITPSSKPSIRARVDLDLPAWFVVLTSYVFALGLGWFSKSTC